MEFAFHKNKLTDKMNFVLLKKKKKRFYNKYENVHFIKIVLFRRNKKTLCESYRAEQSIYRHFYDLCIT